MSQDKKIEIARHSCAHILAAAAEQLYPGSQFGVGPVVEKGFYYDIKFPKPITEDELKKIEKKAKEIIKQKIDFEKKEMPLDEAISFFKDKGQGFKVSLLQDLKKHGTTKMSEDEMQDIGDSVDKVTIYKTGEFVDLCKGPHISNTSELSGQGFKIFKLAGAYWRGDENNDQLQRVYGIYFDTKKELDDHLLMIEEAKKRDHRKIGKDLDLFTFSDLVGPGLALWTPKGATVRNILDDFVWELRKERGYKKVAIPHITKKDLYEKSGHWEKFKDDLFKIKTREGHLFALKPMNCPHHTQIYDHIPRSYRDLPQRYAETTMVYRDEQTGELAGLSRVRCITQDDAHVFCRDSQLKEEMLKIWDIVDAFYKGVGFEDMKVTLSLHDPNNFDKYLGTPEVWKIMEDQLRDVSKARGVKVEEIIGEAAMYGPKIDFIAKDSIGREWQVATIQIDRNMPERFDLNCINEKGEKERIVMLHAAIMGSMERFLAVYIEHTAGAFPLWMAPVQVQIISVADSHIEFANTIIKEFEEKDIRVELDDSNETVGNKIRKSSQLKVPYMLVIGDKEKEGGNLSIRKRGEKDNFELPIKDFIKNILKEIQNKE